MSELQSELEIDYVPAVGLNSEGKPDYFWSDWTRDLSTIDTIIIHSMFAADAGENALTIEACRDLLNSLGTSAHIFIDQAGRIARSVDDLREAWQAGKSKMPEPDNRQIRNSVNAFSVGIELVEKDGVTQEHYIALVRTVAQLMMYLPIKNILGHRDVATAAVRKDPKTDPENFDWELFFALLAEIVPAERMQQLNLVGKN